ncbi:MAG: SDR family oxidoreductase [Alicyclobacillus sp.]|nr:SDR family oxidoreductase [Alicyclobacillus sp.]
MSFDNKVVVITGAGGGMGRETAMAFAQSGAKLALCDVSAENLEQTAEACRPATVVTGIVDLCDVGAIYEWLQEVKNTFGNVQILANCAGVWHAANVEDVTERDWNFVIDVNLKGTFFFCQACMRQMREAGGGAIVNIASTAGEYGSIRPAAPYAASKGGVIALTKSLAREGAPIIRVNAISPGPVDTPMLANTEEEKREIAKRPLVGRLGTPRDIAAGILYLCGDDAGYITGEVLRINGGSLL